MSRMYDVRINTVVNRLSLSNFVHEYLDFDSGKWSNKHDNLHIASFTLRNTFFVSFYGFFK